MPHDRQIFLPWRRPVPLLTFTSVPGCPHEVSAFFDLMIPSPSSLLNDPSMCLEINRLSEFYNGSFFNVSTAIAPARSTVSRASAHMARVICRYQPAQLRTS
jgi:hypothetical protein